MRPTWVEVSLPRLRENFSAIRRHVGERVAVVPVLKANAYGHGAETVAQALAAEGAAWFGVTTVSEALPLRSAGISQPILLFSGFWPGEEEALAEHRLIPFVCDPVQLEWLESYGARRALAMPFHLKLDTGMGRLGLPPAELGRFLKMLDECHWVRFEGLCTHFASADSPDSSQTRSQIELFECLRQRIAQAGYRPGHLHMANSAGLALFAESHGTMVRPGLALYGYQGCATPLDVTPVLSLKSRVLSVRRMEAGTPLGYGATYVTPAPASIGIVPAGYADGIPRLLSNRGHALVNGCRAPIVGRVSMDLTLLDLTGVPDAQVGDEAAFIGGQGRAKITAVEVAGWAGTIPYEVVCNINSRVPRVYVES